uniref:Uncharacterized protein n=1 Tax=Oryza punctata TaxID=4537 RepID=A0A0E0KFK6_ORYPU
MICTQNFLCPLVAPLPIFRQHRDFQHRSRSQEEASPLGKAKPTAVKETMQAMGVTGLTTHNIKSHLQVCTGAKSEQQSKLAARKYARIIQKLGYPAKFKDFKIQNIVGSCDVKFPIRLEGLAYSYGAFSNKIVLTGAKKCSRR